MVTYCKPRAKLHLDWWKTYSFQWKKTSYDCPKLYFLDDTSPVYLHTDAEDYGIGAYLVQVVQNVEYPIIILSQAFKANKNVGVPQIKNAMR